MRPSVRGVLLDHDERLVLFRRTVPGRPLYWTVPGGHVEPEDGSLEDTLHRELLEELGATVYAVTPLVSVSYPWRGEVKTQHVFGCRLKTMDPELRHGPEFEDPAYGLYEVEHVPLARSELHARNLIPQAVAGYLAALVTRLPRLIP
ncbi:NUDIX hydrolase [Nonomuraea sp. NPDC048882]|uniref:NUDIX hydrolase n=1 Tax=unclassified Nonomuraea TaxID=2593643 RepID=UPI000ACFD3C9